MFKRGDRVKYISNDYRDTERNPLWRGKHGKVSGVVSNVVNRIDTFNISVSWDNGCYNLYKEHDLEYIESDFVEKIFKDLENII